MQHGFRECDLSVGHVRRPALTRNRTIDDQGIAAGLRRRPEQRHVGLARDVLGSGRTHGAADAAAAKLDGHMAGVRTIFGDREQIGLVAVVGDRLGERADRHDWSFLGSGLRWSTHTWSSNKRVYF